MDIRADAGDIKDSGKKSELSTAEKSVLIQRGIKSAKNGMTVMSLIIPAAKSAMATME
ncbi:MAG: hypothetical protein LBB62_07145 [Proteiniphilum sp.]|jgi:hypothetical protein|nr:hypothetical protein [Proteiniphilum sp.]